MNSHFVLIFIILHFPKLQALMIKGGTEIGINIYTTYDQRSPDIATLSDGTIVIVYNSYDQDGSYNGVYMRRYDSNGNSLSSEVAVNQYTSMDQYEPVISALSGCTCFVVVWTSSGQDGSYSGVYARIFGNNMSPISTELLVPDSTTSYQLNPDVVGLPNGNFAIVWGSYHSGSNYDSYGKIMNQGGSTVVTEFRLNSYMSENQLNPRICVLTTGNLITTWTSSNQDGSGAGVYAAMFYQSGSYSVTEFQVNTYTNAQQAYPACTALPGGKFVITWSSSQQDGDSSGIFFKIFNSAGTSLTGDLQANIYATNDQLYSDIASYADGSFVISWSSIGQLGTGYESYARIFDVNGNGLTTEILLNTYTTDHQDYPKVITLNNSWAFYAVWSSGGQDGSSTGVYGKLFREQLCVDSAYYYFTHNGSCMSSCPTTGFSSSTDYVNLKCTFSCTTGHFYHIYNSSCLPSCPSLPGFSQNVDFCDFACTSGEFYYPSDSSCASTCSGSGYETSTSADKSYCNLKCPGGYYHGYNSSCLTTCPSAPGFTQSGIYCNFACTSGQYYVVADTNCIASCSTSGYVVTTQNDKLFCDFKCPSSLYHAYNDSCLAACSTDPGFSTTGQYCNFACTSSKFYNLSDSTCLDACSDPSYSIVIDADKKYCKFKCSSGLYHAYDETCLSSCPSMPGFNTSGQYCDFICPQSKYFYPATSSCASTCPTKYYSTSYTNHMYCYDCISNCDICTNATICLFCSSGYYWNGVECLSTCATGYFASDSSRVCELLFEFEVLGPQTISVLEDVTITLYIYTPTAVTSQTIYNWSVMANVKNDSDKFTSLQNFLATQSKTSVTIPRSSIESGVEYNFSVSFYDVRGFPNSKTYTAIPTCSKGNYRIFGLGCQGICVIPCAECLDASTCLYCLKYAFMNPYTRVCEMNSYVKLTSPSIVSNCSDLTLSASINQYELYSYAITFHWDIASSPATNLTNVKSILASQYQNIAFIPDGILIPGVTYSITVYYVNIMSQTVSDIKDVVCDAFIYPSIEIVGGAFQFLFPNKANTIDFQSKFTKCSDQTEIYTLMTAQPRLESTNFTKGISKITIPKCGLTPNQTSGFIIYLFFRNKIVDYTFSVQAKSYDYLFYVDKDNLLHPASSPLQLKGIVSYQEECDTYSGVSYQYFWSCTKKISLTPSNNNNCSDPQNIFYVSSSSNSIIIPASYVIQGETYIFTVTLQDGDVQKTATSEVEVGPAATISIKIFCDGSLCTDRYNFANLPRLSVEADAPLDSSLEFSWDVNSIFDFKAVGKYLFLEKKAGSTSTQSAFSFAVSFANSTHSGKSKFLLNVNTPPSSGSLTIYPSTGYALDTFYRISSLGWIDDDAPLSYQFSYNENENSTSYRILSQAYFHPVYITLLPAPNVSETLYIQVNISDSMGATSYIRMPIQVRKKFDTLNSVAAQIQGIMDNLNTEDLNQKLNIISLSSKTLKDVEPSFKPSYSCGDCSGHGVCQLNQTCTCFGGYTGLDCSITNIALEELTASKLSMLSLMSDSIVKEKDNSALSTMVLDSIKDITQNPGYVNRSVIDSVENILEQNMNLLNNKTTISASERGNVMDITSNIITFLSTEDCNCQSSKCQAYGTKLNTYFDRISSYALENPDLNNPVSYQTSTFNYKIVQTSICNISSLAIGDTKDIVNLNPLSSENPCSKIVGVKYLTIADREELFTCTSSTANQNRRFLISGEVYKNTKIGISVIDIESKQDISDKFGVNIQNPSSNSCPPKCDQSKSGNMVICTCLKAIEFDPKSQIKNVFASSDLVKIQNIGALLDWNPLTSPVFWFDMVVLGWYFFTYWVLGKPKIKEFNLINKFQGTISMKHAVLLTYMEQNALCNIYLFQHEKFSKRLRCTTFTFRIVLFGFFNSAFLSMMKQQDLLEQITNFQLFLLMLPYWTMLPVKLAIESLLSCLDKKMQSPKYKKRFAVLFPLFSNLFILVFMFLTIIIAANNSTGWALSWLTKLSINIIVDLLISPFIAILINYADYRHRYSKKSRSHFDKVGLKKETAKISPMVAKMEDKEILVEDAEPSSRNTVLTPNVEKVPNQEIMNKTDERIVLNKKVSPPDFQNQFFQDL